MKKVSVASWRKKPGFFGNRMPKTKEENKKLNQYLAWLYVYNKPAFLKAERELRYKNVKFEKVQWPEKDTLSLAISSPGTVRMRIGTYVSLIKKRQKGKKK